MKFLFMAASTLTGFFSGLVVAALTIPKNSGLTGPATILMDGLVGGLLLFIIAIILIKKITPKFLKKITIILFLLNLLPIGWIVYRLQLNNSNEEPKKKPIIEKTKPILTSSLFFQSSETEEMGMGMAKPDFFNRKSLYFYSLPNLEKTVSEHIPSDSLTFSQTENGYEIGYAPPWFYPEHQKLDYEILYLKIISLGRDWIQVEVNRKTNLKKWISATDVEVLLWPQFLLKVFSIEILEPSINMLRVRPLPNASLYQAKEFSILSPVMIKDKWIKVELHDDHFIKIGEAWLQWNKDGKLLISYSLLS